MSDEIWFYEMNENMSSVVKIKTMQYSDIEKCPYLILVPTHYNDDGSCRCSEIVCEQEDCLEPKFISFDEDGTSYQEIYCEKHLEGY